MKIEVWSDFVCPFCYIGKRRLEKALVQFPHKDNVEVVYKSFELDRNASKDTEQSLYEILANKYGTTVEQAEAMSRNVAQQATTVGLEFNFDKSIPTNTFDAHRIAKFAETKGKDAELTERLLYAHFTEGKHIGNTDTLIALAEEVGLTGADVQAVLAEGQFEEAVRKDEAQAQRIGVQGVPFFVLNEKYAISGAQPTETFVTALEKVWQEENETTPLQSLNKDDAQGNLCGDDGCDR